MRTKVFRATCPRRVLWGDPVYLAGDTVDTAASVIKEQSIPEFSGEDHTGGTAR